VIKRKIHKERPQPAERKKLGLLEKHKDYKQRAKDYHRKEDALNRLREKAALRNPDEYYTGMHKTETKVRLHPVCCLQTVVTDSVFCSPQDGVHVATRGKKRTFSELKSIKTQDVGFLNMKSASESKVGRPGLLARSPAFAVAESPTLAVRAAPARRQACQ
jgi:U3 small nucleolar RNA-associated protein 11